jgi:hypothetical protein
MFDEYEPDYGKKKVMTILVVSLVLIGMVIGFGIGLLI